MHFNFQLLKSKPIVLAELLGLRCVPDRFDFQISIFGPRPMLDTAVRLLISTPRGQGCFRMHIYFIKPGRAFQKNKPLLLFFFFLYQYNLDDSAVNERDEKHDLRNIKIVNIDKQVWLLVSYPTINFTKQYSGSLNTMHENAQWSLTGVLKPCRTEMISITENQFPVNGKEAKFQGNIRYDSPEGICCLFSGRAQSKFEIDILYRHLISLLSFHHRWCYQN